MLYKLLPYPIFRILFGDRKKYGLTAQPNDPEFKRWQQNMMTFYNAMQKGSKGSGINNMGFKIVRHLDLTHKHVVEIGPGIIEHLKYTSTRPPKYTLVDIRQDFLDHSTKALQEFGVKNIETVLTEKDHITLPNECADIVLSFHQLEHIERLDTFTSEIARILRPGGILAGAVPCEGGLAWGMGRALTSRRYAINKLKLNYDKIICWEHPNFVTKIKNSLDQKLTLQKSIKKPFGILPFDCNLSRSFIYKKEK